MASSATELRPQLDGLQASIDAVAESDLRAELIEIRRAIDRLESVFARGFRRFEGANKYAADGALSPISWLRWMCRLSPGAALDRLAVARQLPALPQTEAAFASGDIGYHHVAVIARSAEDLGAETMRKREEDFLASAREMDPGRFYTAAKELRYMLDAGGALAEANRAHKRRWLDIRQMWDGVYRFEARLDPEGGALVHATIRALSAPGKGDDRSGVQRQADAPVNRTSGASFSVWARGGVGPHKAPERTGISRSGRARAEAEPQAPVVR